MPAIWRFASVISVLSAIPIGAGPVEIDWGTVIVGETFLPSDLNQEAEPVALWLDLSPGSSWTVLTESEGHREVGEDVNSLTFERMDTSIETVFQMLDVTSEGIARLQKTEHILSNRLFRNVF